jgi:autotransporter translocation and assembly factor TamB/Tfp pilus assembly major pilin PilA
LKTYLQKSLRVFTWLIAIVFAFVFAVLIIIQVPAFQNFAKEKIVTYLNKKVKTKVVIQTLKIEFPQKIVLEGVYFEDQNKDTLLSGKKIAVDISLLQLINNNITINTIDLNGITANISKNKVGVFNFDYLIKAFETPKKEPVAPSDPLVISLGKINLDTINIRYNDAYGESDITLKLQHLNTRIENFDLDKMDFAVPKVKVQGLQLQYIQGLVQNKIATTEETNAPKLKLSLGELDLSKIDIIYKDEQSQLNTTLDFKKLFIKFDKTDLSNQVILVDNIELNNAKGSLSLGKIKKIIASTPAATAGRNEWDVKIKKLSLNRIGFTFDDDNAKAVQKGIDYKHLQLNGLSSQINSIHYSNISTSATVASLSVKEKSGLAIESFTADLFYGRKNAFFKNLYLKTPQTIVQNQIEIGYPSIESIANNLGDISINANLQKSTIGFKDILVFVPTLANTNPFKDNPNAILKIDTKVGGKLKNISIPKLQISGIGSTIVNASGKITGLPNVDKANFDLVINQFETTAKDLNSFVPKGTIPNTIQLPAAFNLKGSFKGSIQDFYTDLVLGSSYGGAKIKGKFNQTIKNREKYNAKAELQNFDLGKLIKNAAVGKLSLNTTISGTGLDPKSANASLDGTIKQLYYNKYNYQNLALKGKINNGSFEASANSIDPNLTFDLVANGGFNDKYPKGKIKLNLDIADLEKLNLHAGPLKIRGDVVADIQSADLDYLNGSFNILNLTVADEKEEFVTDSISLIAVSDATKNSLIIKSPFLIASVDGKYKLSKIGAAISNSVAHYYGPTTTAKQNKAENQSLAFDLKVTDSPLLLKLVPAIKSLEPIAISGRYNSINDSIVLSGSIPKLVFGTNTITNAKLTLDKQDDALVYNIMIDDIQNDQFQLPYTQLNGVVEKNILDYNLLLKDLQDKDRYTISGLLKVNDNTTEIQLDPTKLMLNYESWSIDPKNSIRFGKQGINASDFELSNSGSSIKIQSQNRKENAPLAIDFKDFKIETISSMVEKSDLQINGNINGNALVKNLSQSPIFTADLDINNFAFKKDTLGNIKIQIDNTVANTLNTAVAITGQGNQVDLKGAYKIDNGALAFDLLIGKLNLKSIQGFTLGNLKESTGYLNGDFNISGNSSDPKINGDLQFNAIGFKVSTLNATFQSMNDKITFVDDAIVLKRFTIKDEKDNDLVVDGSISSKNLTNPGFDLTIVADNFQALNSKEKDNDLFYGEMYLDNKLSIKGDLSNPVVEGIIKVNKDTKFTIVMPQSDPSIADREGIVEFIDQDNPTLITKIAEDKNLSQTEITGINASVNIEIDKEASLSIVIDKANGDFLELKGEAQLNGGIDPSGKTTLTGRYELKEGAYEMNFNFIKRKFDIKDGSYILWTGEPTAADINITAVYKNEAAPIDLVNDQLGGAADAVRNTYKQKIPFETELKMNGDLMKPSISFDIVLPDGNNSVSAEVINTTQSKLTQLRQQPDELNKQVFALLLLNRFIGENPFASEAGGSSVASIARESASKILSQQLNNLAGDLINGVELNFDLNTSQDFTTGQEENKTDLSVGVSKRLFNDRLKVTVGSSFGLEGPQQANETTNNIAGDVSVEYQLSQDGRYKLKAYRLNKYQVALQGQVIETGIAFILTLDYNKFRELFQSSKDKKEEVKTKKK